MVRRVKCPAIGVFAKPSVFHNAFHTRLPARHPLPYQDSYGYRPPTVSNYPPCSRTVPGVVRDDTVAIQRGLDELGKPGHSPVLFLPSGTYRITKTVVLRIIIDR